MCTVFEVTWAEGKEVGKAEGRAEGKAEGREEGRAEGIRALILDNLEEGKSKEQIILKLQKRFSLEEAEARIYVEELA